MPHFGNSDPFTSVTSFFNSGLWGAMRLGLEVFFVLLWLSLIWWTYQDVRRRSESTALGTIALVLAIFLPFVGPVIYLIIRPPELLIDARERELELVALERRLEELGDEEGRRIVARMITREGVTVQSTAETNDLLRKAGAVTVEQLDALEQRLSEIELRLRVTDRIRQEAPAPGPSMSSSGETDRSRTLRRSDTERSRPPRRSSEIDAQDRAPSDRRTRPNTPRDSGGTR